MAIDPNILSILCCPETKQPLALADGALIEQINGAVSRGVLVNKEGGRVITLLDGGLIRKDLKILYAIREDIPVLLVEEGIPLDQLSQ